MPIATIGGTRTFRRGPESPTLSEAFLPALRQGRMGAVELARWGISEADAPLEGPV